MKKRNIICAIEDCDVTLNELLRWPDPDHGNIDANAFDA